MKRFLWVFLAALIFWVAFGNFIFNQYRLGGAFDQARERLISIAANAVLVIDAAQLLEVPLQRTGDSSAAYRAVAEKLETIKRTNPGLKYAYILMATDQPGILQYAVDADPAPQVITAKGPSALPGDKYDARKLPEMLMAYTAPNADKKISRDAWGSVISGYAPIRDANGKSIAILGVDIDAARIDKLQKNARLSGLAALGALFIFIFSLFAVVIFRSKDTF
jgi:hypothetical protein